MTVEIRGIAGGGDGVGTLDDGMTVFVPRTAPGDRVTLAGLDRHRRFARGTVESIVEPSADRAEPRCRHYGRDRCGGCQLQHLSAEAQRRAKARIVGDALRRIGHLEAADPPIEPAVEQWAYRTRITLTAESGGRRIGYHRLDRPDRVFDLERCEIAAAEIGSLWDAVRSRRSLLPSTLDRLSLRLDRGGRRHLIAHGADSTAWTAAARLHQALEHDGLAATLWWIPPGGAARIVAGDRAGPAGAVFEQVNPPMGDRVRRHAVAALGSVSGRRVWDLYAGIGETTELLLAAGATVESIELDPRAVEAAARRIADEARVRRLVGRAEELVGDLRPADLIITNPPRTGMDGAVIDGIARQPATRLVYVSCDPATLARDLRRLLAAWPSARIADLRAFDLFPQTAHVEVVVVVERDG